MNHAFDTEVAKEIGIIPAIIFNHILFWCESNKANNVNEHDGKFWTFHSVKDLQDTFEYMTPWQIRHGLDVLVEKGFIEVGNYNKLNIDRTRWFCVKRSDLMNSANGLWNTTNGLRNTTIGLRNSADQYHINHTDKSHHINNRKETKKESSFDSIFDSYSVIKDNPALKETFVEFVKMRKANKKPLTDKALKLNINKAVDLGNGDPETIQKVVEQTIANGWQGMFPLKTNGSQPRKQTVTNEFERMLNGEEVESFNEFEELLRKETRT